MSAGAAEPATPTRLIWDLPVRLAHWALVACVAGGWATHCAGTAWFAWHRRCGCAVLVLALFRILWGFLGTRHARFVSFVRGPRAVLAYLSAGAFRHGAGHNPLGALSVIVMLALLALQGATGLFANDEIADTGPLFGWISQQASNRITSLHRLNAEALAILIALHVAAVLWYSLRRGEPLVRAMITGRREASAVPAEEEIAGSRTWLAALIVALLSAALALAIRAAPPGEISPF